VGATVRAIRSLLNRTRDWQTCAVLLASDRRASFDALRAAVSGLRCELQHVERPPLDRAPSALIVCDSRVGSFATKGQRRRVPSFGGLTL
jgi:hypothetical protein